MEPTTTASRPHARRRWLAVLTFALSLAAVLATPAPADGATPSMSRDEVENMCRILGGIYYSVPGGQYGCFDPASGLATECNVYGDCQTVCYVKHGCDCDLLYSEVDVCVLDFHAKPNPTDAPRVPADDQVTGHAAGDRPTPTPGPGRLGRAADAGGVATEHDREP